MNEELQQYIDDKIAELKRMIEEGHNHDGNNSIKTDDNGNQGTILSDDTKDALAGSFGTPDDDNRYLTEDDADTAATADKVVRRGADGSVTVPSTPDADTEAASKGYVDDVTLYTTASDINQLRDQTAGVSSKSFKVYLPGTIRIKVYCRTNDVYGYLGIYVVYPLDATGTGTGAGFIDDDMVSNLVYHQESSSNNVYRTFDIAVRAGDVIRLKMSSGDWNDLQVNYTVNVKTDDYSEFI